MPVTASVSASQQGRAWTFLALDVGVEQGLFAKQGIDVEIV